MAIDLRKPDQTDDAKRRGMKPLAAAVAVMIVAGVVALVLVATGGSGSKGNNTNNAAAAQPNSSNVGKQSVVKPKAKVAVKPAVKPAATNKTNGTTKSGTKNAQPKATKKSNVGKLSSNAKPSRSITYTVKKGDNLTVIAAWFHQHGYGDLYDRNKAVIGNDPDLIFPGEKITVSGKGMKLNG